jgi:hypothetical protein
MKKFIALLLTAALFLPVLAQDDTKESPEKNVLKVNLLPLIIKTGSIFYERELTKNLSGQLGVGYLNYKFDNLSFSGLFLTPEVRIYPRGNAIDGFYVAPYGRFQQLNLEAGDGKATYTNYGGGLVFGRQWITNSGFTLDFFFGGHYGTGSVDVTTPSTTEKFDTKKFEGFRTRVGLALGFAF